MHNLIEFLAKYKHWILFVILEVASMVMLFRFNYYQGSVWLTSANYATGKVYEASSYVESFLGMASRNSVLTQRNLYLEQQVRLLSEKLRERDTVSVAVSDSDYVRPEGLRLIPARVVSNSINKPDNFITIDRGSADGVRADMGVVCGTGVVGIVYLVSEHYSVVIPVLNSKSNISCSIEGKDYFGYLHWTGGASTIAYVDDIPRHAKFRLHSKIVTSGYSSVFPPGILVGEVLHVYNSADGLSYRLQVKLSADFSRLRDVCVISDATMKERSDLLKAANDSIKAK